jgi:hypothetical protein
MSAFIKNNLNRDAQVKKTIAEIQLITEAAQKYQSNHYLQSHRLLCR